MIKKKLITTLPNLDDVVILYMRILYYIIVNRNTSSQEILIIPTRSHINTHTYIYT